MRRDLRRALHVTHAKFSVATNVSVFFCDPHSPWQRGSNEDSNGLLRQYFPRTLDLNTVTRADLSAAAHELNSRPRQAHRLDETMRGVRPDCCLDRLRPPDQAHRFLAMSWTSGARSSTPLQERKNALSRSIRGTAHGS